MVESVTSYEGGEAPSLTGERPIRSSEPVLAGSAAYWPAAYVIEGLAQCCNLAAALRSIESRLEDGTLADALARMDNVDANGAEPANIAAIGMLASVDIAVVGRVAAGDVLTYEVRHSRVVRELSRYTARAFVGDRTVAHGILVGARLEGRA